MRDKPMAQEAGSSSGEAAQQNYNDGRVRPAFTVGSRVKVNINPPHMAGQSTGEVREAVLTWVYAVVFDGMEEMGAHKWYTESELMARKEPGRAR